ncbi:DUF6328 family protein [Streptomyces sp. NPDC057555]|uniref:DUF6328 family protein n=1 Tax=Streptomyces sp. NPDC057555 TaxID=3346166 RepID=UPI0036A32461
MNSHRDDGTPESSWTRGRRETREERADRRWTELLQEVRVIQTGVQILFGFLLTVVFTPRFTTLGTTDLTIYVITLLLGAATTGALMGTVTFHRLVSGHRLKPQTVLWASRLALVGVVLLLGTMTSALLLILRLTLSGSAALWVVAILVAWFVVCWFVLPAWVLHRYSSRE